MYRAVLWLSTLETFFCGFGNGLNQVSVSGGLVSVSKMQVSLLDSKVSGSRDLSVTTTKYIAPYHMILVFVSNINNTVMEWRPTSQCSLFIWSTVTHGRGLPLLSFEYFDLKLGTTVNKENQLQHHAFFVWQSFWHSQLYHIELQQ